MFDRPDIRAAVEAGAISDEGAKRFEAFLKARNDPERMLDPENLRFLTNFNDVFLTIGIVVLMTGLGFLSAISVINMLGLPGTDPQTLAEATAFAGRVSAYFFSTIRYRADVSPTFNASWRVSASSAQAPSLAIVRVT